MRKDLAQLLVERPRLYRGEQYRVHRHRANRDLETVPLVEGMRRIYSERKQFNEYFAPLQGNLRASVGRPWDKVYSEIMASLRGGGTVIEHVRTHLLRDFVVRNPYWNADGVPCYPPDRLLVTSVEVPLGERGEVWYVDQHGILRFAPRKTRFIYRHRSLLDRVPCDDESGYYKLNDIWYRVWTTPLPKAGPEVVAYDQLLGESFKPYDSWRYGWMWPPLTRTTLERANGGLRLTTNRKMQLCSRDIHRLKLNERLGK